jgi:hypothetical protein
VIVGDVGCAVKSPISPSNRLIPFLDWRGCCYVVVIVVAVVIALLMLLSMLLLLSSSSA